MKDQEKYKQHSDLVWTIANLLRGPYRPPQYRRVMIPLTVLRRLDCVLEDRKDEVAALYKQLKEADDARPEAKRMGDESIEKIVFNKTGLSFFNKSGLSFQTILADSDHIARNLNYYIASFSTRARSILEKFKFEEEIEKLDESNRLFEVVKEFAGVDFHPDRIPNADMGNIFEDLVRRFNEQANEEAGDHFTPREVVKLMVKLLFTGEEHIYKAGKVIKIYDPTCGTGGILSESEKAILEENDQANIELFGQEYNPESYAICGSDLMIKGEDVRNIVFGDTLGTGRPKEGQTDGDGHPDERFHYMAANPPFGVEWKPEKDHVTREHETFGFDGRFGPGLPRINDGALLFLLHMISKMQRPPATYRLPVPGGIEGGEGSRIAIIFNGSPLFTGDAGGGESNIRRWIIENDMLEAVVGLPDQLFYNTGIYTYIWIVTNRKAPERQGKVQLINATEFAWKMKKSLGDKRKKLGEGKDGEPDHIAAITAIYAGFGHDERKMLKDIQSNIDPGRDQSKAVVVSKVFHNQDFGYFKITVERPLRLNFAVTDEHIGNVRQSTYFETLAISQKRKNKGEIAEEILAGRQAQQEILRILEGMKPAFADGEPVKDRALFEKQLAKAFKDSDVKLDASLKKALLAPGALGKKDPTAQPCLDAKGNPEPDPDLRDSENVPFPGALLANGRRDTVNPLIDLPLPLDYETAKTKGKVDKSALLELVQDHCEAYLAEEVLPYRPDAWIDHSKTKVGYEIPFNRHFYQYEPPRELSVIEAEIKGLEAEILKMLNENEKRSVLITQMITKGLNPDAPMRPSGVDWLGDVPAHWDIRKLKFCIDVQGGGTPNTSVKEYWDGDIPWVSPKDMKAEYITQTQDYITELGLQESATNQLKAGTVLIVVRSGILRHSIPVAINVVPVSINQDMKGLIPHSGLLLNEYLMALIQGFQKALLPIWSKPGCTVESVELEYMMNTPIPLPPIEEQNVIFLKIKEEKKQIDAMLKIIDKTIECLTEYRTALITAAVTGKIDISSIDVPDEEAA